MRSASAPGLVPRLAAFAAGGVALGALAACVPAAGTTPETNVDADGFITVELATVGVDARAHTPVVLLRDADSGMIVPIWVGVPEAHAILRTMLGLETARPMTHDLLVDVIHGLGATVEEVVVHDVQDATYIGRIRLRVGSDAELRDIDSRPSDALALSIRTDAPIRVAPGLLSDPPEFDFIAPEADEQVVRILGATVVVPSTALRERFRLPDRPGLVVVGASGAAADHGVRRGDLVLEVNGRTPVEPMEFLDAVLAAEDGVSIRVWRNGEEHSLELPPAAAPPTAPDMRRGPPPIQT